RIVQSSGVPLALWKAASDCERSRSVTSAEVSLVAAGRLLRGRSLGRALAIRTSHHGRIWSSSGVRGVVVAGKRRRDTGESHGGDEHGGLHTGLSFPTCF